ncbi:ribonuclease P protein component [bacterium]|nr:ribonuclease P protein component [bacterium]
MRSDDQGRAPWRSLSRASEFSVIYEEGVKLVGRLFVLYLYPGDDLARAVVASRKVGNAVRRNRAKRLLREAFRACVEKDPALVADLRRRYWPDRTEPATLWLVAVARTRIVGAGCDEVIAELTSLLQRPAAPAASDRPDRRLAGRSRRGDRK